MIGAQEFFNEATLYQRNDGGGPIDDPTTALMLLNMLVAHIADLNSPKNADGSLVGRIASAAEGSVNVSTEYAVAPGSEKWYAQTKYGAAWWQATTTYRTMRYKLPRYRPNFPFPFG